MDLFYILIVAGVILSGMFFLMITRFLGLWFQALVSGTPVSLLSIVGMSLRKIPPKVVVNAYINAHHDSFSEHSKLNQWATVVLGERLEEGVDISTDIFKDKILKVEIEAKPSKKTNIPFNRVTSILGVDREI